MSTVSTTFRKTGLCMAILIIPFFTISCTHLRPNDYGVSESHKDELLDIYTKGNGILMQIADRVNNNQEIQGFDDEKRNDVIEDVMYLIDKGFEEFSHKLYENRATFNVFGDVANLGLSTAGTLVGSSAAKTTYAALAAAFNGAQFSVDSHYFQDQGTFTLIRMMEAERELVKTEILVLMKKNASEYTIGMAFIDLGRYFKSGTLAHALNKITQNAGEEITLQSNRQNLVKQFVNHRDALLALWSYDKETAENKSVLTQQQIESILTQEDIDKINENAALIPDRVQHIISSISVVENEELNLDTEKLKALTDGTVLEGSMYERLRSMNINDLTSYLENNDSVMIILYRKLSEQEEN